MIEKTRHISNWPSGNIKGELSLKKDVFYGIYKNYWHDERVLFFITLKKNANHGPKVKFKQFQEISRSLSINDLIARPIIRSDQSFEFENKIIPFMVKRITKIFNDGKYFNFKNIR